MKNRRIILSSFLIIVIGIITVCLCPFLDDGEGYIGMAILGLGMLIIVAGVSLLISMLFFKYVLKGKVIDNRAANIVIGAFLVLMIIRLLLRTFTDWRIF